MQTILIHSRQSFRPGLAPGKKPFQSIEKVVHIGILLSFKAVNKFSRRFQKLLELLVAMSFLTEPDLALNVNKPVDKNRLLESKNLIWWSQFIERTEMGNGSQQIDVERLMDNPRWLGKGQGRLVGLAPLKPERNFGSGGRIHQFLWQGSRLASNAKRNWAVRNAKPFRIESSSSGKFRVWANRSYQRLRLLLWISTGGRLWRFPKLKFAKWKTLKGGTNWASEPGRAHGPGKTGETFRNVGDSKSTTADLWTKSNLRVKRRDPWRWANALPKAVADLAQSGQDAERS